MQKVLSGFLLFLVGIGAHAGTGSVQPIKNPSGYDFYIGASGWYADANGGIDAPGIGYTLKLDSGEIAENGNSVIYVIFEHPNRFLPDILLGRNNIRHNGKGTLDFQGTNNPIEGTINLSHTDLTMYYRVSGNDLGFLDLGLTTRAFDGELQVEFTALNYASTSDLSTLLGLLYLHTGIYLPRDNLSMGLTINAGDNGKERSADASLYMQYETPVGIGFTGGYRHFMTDIESEGRIGTLAIDIGADFNVYGPFLTVYYHL